ncbi:MAG: VTT domain-containing protein [Chitinophagales bacterium]|nr:VTT domain-containing protein [Chitinophagales bacterium]MDW8393319.1 VTT domain-containing protein [Chitinophagales bacterium]
MLVLSVADIIRHILEDPGALFNPEELLRMGGFALLLLMIFAETGIFFCFFFPGDSLVFTAGVLTATGDLHDNVWTVIFSMIIAATLGNITGYLFGRSVGMSAYRRKESWFFKKEYLVMADNFYKKYGGLALIGGRFFPIIRTFAPIVAGIIRVDFKIFLFYTIVGAIVWIMPLVLAGYYLGKIPFVEQNLGWIILFLVIVITSPVIFRLIRISRSVK